MNGKARHYFPGNNTPVGFFVLLSLYSRPKRSPTDLVHKGRSGNGEIEFYEKNRGNHAGGGT